MRTKITVLLVVIIAAAFIADGVIERNVVLPKFAALEREQGDRNLRRVERAIHQEAQQLAQVTRNFGEWDDAYDFIQTRNPAFVRSSLAPTAFPALKANLIHYYDAEGKLVWGEIRDTLRGAPLKLAGLPAAGFPPESPLLRRARTNEPVAGLLAVGDQLLWVASYPIVTSKGEGPVRGTVVFGRLLSKSDEKRLADQVTVNFVLLPRTAGSAPATAQNASPQDAQIVYDQSQNDVMRASTPLVDILGKPVRWIEATVPRRITAEGRDSVLVEQGWTLLVSVILLVAAYVSFGRLVVYPVQRLVQHVQWIRQSGDLAKQIDIATADEVGMLAEEFNHLLAQIARSRAARHRSESQLKAVLQDQTDLIRRFLPDGTTTFVNRAYARFFGRAEEQSFLGQKEVGSVPDEDRPKIIAHLDALGPNCPVTEVEHRVVLANGETHWLHWTTHAIFDQEGKVAELQSVGHEVLDHARDEATLAVH
ncbi:MAG: CHASE4 domain-containing protein [Pirellulales bacterium]